MKRIAAGALFYSGLLRLMARFALRDRLVVLTYHRVLPPDADCFSAPGIVVRPGTFARHMAFVRRFFRVLSADDLVATMSSGRAAYSRACLVTFDDGWQDNLTHALPIVVEHRVPMLLFVATRYIGSADCFWQERTARTLLALSKVVGQESALGHEFELAELARATGPIARVMAYERAARLKALPPAQFEAAQERIRQQCEAAGVATDSNGEDRFLSWREVLAMLDSGFVSLGSHAATHRPLHRLSREEIDAELTEASAAIRERTGRTPELLAYPNGDVDDKVAAAAAAAGLTACFTTATGHVTAGDDRFRLRRINVHEGAAGTVPELLCKILGIF